MKNKKYRVEILPLFERDLNEAADYIRYELCNVGAAKKLIDDVEVAILRRKENPEAFEKFYSMKERKYPYYRIYVGNYIIFYVVIDEVMEIRRLIYNRRKINI